jgi:hypothetical protein
MNISMKTCLVLAALSLATLGACAGGDGPLGPAGSTSSESSGSPTVPSTVTRASAASRAAGDVRASKPVQDRYRLADVRHSFRSALGDDIDCVDFAAEPGVRALVVRGESVDALRCVVDGAAAAHHSIVREPRGASDAHYNGDQDSDGRARACPAGSTPHVRPAAGSVARAAVQKPPKSPTVGVGQNYGGNGDEYAWVAASLENPLQSPVTEPNTGGFTTTAIAFPTFPTDGSAEGWHSVSQLWLLSVDPSSHMRQSVEVGWEVVGPVAGQATAPPFLMVYSTTDNHTYGFSCDVTACASNWLDEPIWVPNGGANPATVSPGGMLPYSVPGGTQHELTMSVEEVSAPGATSWVGWGVWVSIDGAPETMLGYFDRQQYATVASSTYGPKTTSLATGATDFQVGGEVAGAQSVPPSQAQGIHMGEGPVLPNATTAYGADYHRNFGYYDSNGVLQEPHGYVWSTSKDYVYNVNAPSPPGYSPNWFYFGDRAGTAQSQALLGNDFDGDGIADVASSCTSTWCGTTAQLGILTSGQLPVVSWSAQTWVPYGSGGFGALPVPRDYDGDGKSDPAIWSASTGIGVWTIFNSTGPVTSTSFGMPGDIPVSADYNGDGKADIAVWRPSGLHWYVAGVPSITWGYVFGTTTADIPVPADYDGDQITDLAYWTVDSAQQGWWHILPSSGGRAKVTPYGIQYDIPVPADYDGDGKTDIAVYRPSLQQWFILNSGTPEWRPVFTTPRSGNPFGGGPVPADYDGDGATDVAYWDNTGEWDIMSSATQATTHVAWGNYYETNLPYFR